MPRTNKTKPTIKDIQAITGLSLGCISKYLNGGNVTQENRIKLESAIKEIGYTVDVYARGMITGQTKTVGVVIPDLSNTFYGIIASAISKLLNDVGYDVVVNEHFSDIQLEKDLVKKLFARRVDAIVLVPSSNNKDDYESFDLSKIVYLDGFVEGLDANYVLVNNREIAKDVVKYLYKAGHTKIAGIISGGTYTGNERKIGFIEGCKECGLDYNNLIFEYEKTVDKAYETVEKIIKMNEFSAIFATNYISTLGAIFYLNEKNISVPFDVSFIGFDNIMLTKLFKPQLTIVSQPMNEMAKTTVDMILDLINGTNNIDKVAVLECKLERGHTVEIKF